MKPLLILVICYILPFSVFAQSNGTILLISNAKAHLMVDGEDKGYVEMSKPKSLNFQVGSITSNYFMLPMEPRKQIS